MRSFRRIFFLVCCGLPFGSSATCDITIRHIVVKLRLPSTPEQTSQVIGQAQATAGRSPVMLPVFDRRLGEGADLFRVSGSSQQIDQLVADIKRDSRVRYAQKDLRNGRRHSNDPFFPQQWYLGGTGSAPAPYRGNAAFAWLRSTGSGSVIAILDTGVIPETELDQNLLPGFDFVSDPLSARDGNAYDPDATDMGTYVEVNEDCVQDFQPSDWHGIRVASVASAIFNNGQGIAGVAPTARILPVRVSGSFSTSQSELADAITWAIGMPVPGTTANQHPADVISISLGGAGECGIPLQEAIGRAVSLDVPVFVSAGNTNINLSAGPNWPQNCPSVVVVASSNSSGTKSNFSSHSGPVQFAAPGERIMVVSNSGIRSSVASPVGRRIVVSDGTSYSAPYAAATFALARSVTPDATSGLLLETMRRNADASVDCIGCGSGIVNAWRTAESRWLSSSGIGNILLTSWITQVISDVERGEDGGFVYEDACVMSVSFPSKVNIDRFKASPESSGSFGQILAEDFAFPPSLADPVFGGNPVTCANSGSSAMPWNCELHGWIDYFDRFPGSSGWPGQIEFNARSSDGIWFRATVATASNLACGG